MTQLTDISFFGSYVSLILMLRCREIWAANNLHWVLAGQEGQVVLFSQGHPKLFENYDIVVIHMSKHSA